MKNILSSSMMIKDDTFDNKVSTYFYGPRLTQNGSYT